MWIREINLNIVFFMFFFYIWKFVFINCIRLKCLYICYWNFLNHAYTSTLTPMHLRKAKLMFFYVRYPSSAILKVYFPDVKFNKNNTAQLVKWFSNFRYVLITFFLTIWNYNGSNISTKTPSIISFDKGR